MNIQFAAHFRIGSFINPVTRREDKIGRRAEAQLMQLAAHPQLRSLGQNTTVTIKRRGELNYEIRLNDPTKNHRFHHALRRLKDFADAGAKDFNERDNPQDLTIVEFWVRQLLKTKTALPQNRQLHRTQFFPFKPYPGVLSLRFEIKHALARLGLQVFPRKNTRIMTVRGDFQ